MNKNYILHTTLGQVLIENVKVVYFKESFTREIHIDFYLMHANSVVTVKRSFSDKVLADCSMSEAYEMIAKAFDIPGYGSHILDVFMMSAPPPIVYDNNGLVKKSNYEAIKPKKVASGGIIKSDMILSSGSGIPDDVLTKYLDQLPGIYEKAIHPVHKDSQLIKDIIINLNDSQGWTREKIADWLDTLDVDLRFKTVDDTVEDKPVAPVISEQEIKMKQLEDTIKVLTNQINSMQVAIANTNQKFIALKEALKNEQS